MSRALLSLLIAFCFLAQSHGGKPIKEEEPCGDPESCAILEEAKREAIQKLNVAAQQGVKILSEIRMEADEIRNQITETDPVEINNAANAALAHIADAGNKAFRDAIKAGKDQPVFECIVDCELNARKSIPTLMNKFKEQLKGLQGQAFAVIDGTIKVVNNMERALMVTRDNYQRKINDAFSTVGVSWNLEQGMKALDKVLKGSDQLTEDFSKVVENYRNSAREVLKSVNPEFNKLVEEARQCIRGCMQ